MSENNSESFSTMSDTPPVPTTDEKYKTLIETVDSLAKQLKAVATTIRSLRRENTGLQKELEKAVKKSSKKKKERDPNAKPSGFARPTQISRELAEFLGTDPDEFMARTEVTKKITAFVKLHNLQKEDNRRNIDLTRGEEGAKLKNLLSPVLDPATGDPIELTFFNLQRYLKHHFPKSVPKVVESNESVIEEEPASVKKKKEKVVKRKKKRRSSEVA